jgi:hypothetical protein
MSDSSRYFSQYRDGLGHVPSYQASGRPFLTSSLTVPLSSSGTTPLQVKFPSVSRFVTITNTLPGSATNVPLRFGFSANGVKGVENNNFAILNNGESYEGELRVISIHLMSDNASQCSASVLAGLTGIAAPLLASNWSGSAGVG